MPYSRPSLHDHYVRSVYRTGRIAYTNICSHTLRTARNVSLKLSNVGFGLSNVSVGLSNVSFRLRNISFR